MHGIAIHVNNLHKANVCCLFCEKRDLVSRFFCRRGDVSPLVAQRSRVDAFCSRIKLCMNQFSVLNVKESVIRIEFLIFRDCCRRVIVVSAASRKDFFANFVAAARSAGIFAFFQRRYDRNVIPDKIVAIPLKSELPKDFGQRIRPIVFGRDFFRPGRKIRKGSVPGKTKT